MSNFSFSHSVFKRLVSQGRQKVSLCVNGLTAPTGQTVKATILTLFPKQTLVFTCLQQKSFENTVGKGEIARKEQFLLSHSVFYPSGELSATFIKFEIVICKLLQFGRG